MTSFSQSSNLRFLNIVWNSRQASQMPPLESSTVSDILFIVTFSQTLYIFFRFPLFSVVKAENFVVCVYKLRDVYVQGQTKFSPKKPDISNLGTL